MKRVILESPYAGATERNTRYLRRCLRDSLMRGEAPFASHAIYTQDGVLDDTVKDERERGIDAGHAWYSVADACVVYEDFGLSVGMQQGIARAMAAGLPVEMRKIGVQE